MSQDETERAMAIGHENQEMIVLGKSWCTNIRTDRTHMGVGMLEEMTGLPITGGRFDCDFARHPSTISAMQLVVSAVEFYEANCRGCEHRAPGERIPNLGTWAEARIRERDRNSAEADAAEAAALAERERRAAHRTSVAAAFDAATQGIVDLVNRIDLDRQDRAAVESLSQQATLIPDAFSSELRAMLLADAQTLESSDLLGVCVQIGLHDEHNVDDGLRAVCLHAVSDGWARNQGAAYLAAHPDVADLGSEFIVGLVRVAAGASDFIGRGVRGHPEALVAYHSLSAQLIEDEIAAMLRHGHESRRASGARAVRHLVAVDSQIGLRLLGAMLDGLRFADDDHYGGDRGSDYIAHVVADLLYVHPDDVEAAVSSRWTNGTGAYRTRLLHCYDSAVRARRDSATPEVFAVVLSRTVSALGDLPSGAHVGFEDDYQGRAAGLLELAAKDAPAGAIAPDLVVGSLLTWIERQRAASDRQPTSTLEAMELMGDQARIGRIVHDISAAVASVGSHDPVAFIESCAGIFEGAAVELAIRAEIVEVAGRAAATSNSAIAASLPLIYSAMFNESQLVRASGMEAAESLMRALGVESTPPLLARAVTAGLGDQFLIVVTAAVKACRYIPTDVEDATVTAANLMVIAKSYASDRLRHQLVEDALSAALRLSRDDAALYPLIRRAGLHAVDGMDRYNARETLSRYLALEEDPEWTSTAIRALLADQDPQYETFGDDDKDQLLRRLSRRDLSDGQIDELTTGEVKAASWDRRRAIRAAEALAALGRPDKSVEILTTHLDAIPETISTERTRRSVHLHVLRFSYEDAVRVGNLEGRRDIASEMATYVGTDVEEEA